MQLAATDLRAVFGRDVASYDVEPIDPHLRIHSVTGGVYRVRANNDTCVVKVVRHGVDATPDFLWQSGADESHRNYWKREWLAFDSGLLDSLPGRLRAPRTLLTTEHDGGDCWIWMEDVVGRTGSTLDLDDFDTIAYALGTCQGTYAAGTVALPDQPWLSRGWLQSWVDICAPFIDCLGDDDLWRDPRLAQLRELRERVANLWVQREKLIEVTDEPPISIAHWDLWPANLIVNDDRDVVAIDWSQVGLSGITHDLDQLTLDTVWQQVRPDESLDVLEERVLTSYSRGLRAAGLDIDERDLQRWYAAAAALRYSWLAGGQPGWVLDPERWKSQEERFGRDPAQILTSRARVIEHALSHGESVVGR